MQEVTAPERTAPPYSAVCYVTVTFPDGFSSRASGVVIGRNDVLTALHVVYRAEHGGWASTVGVTPGADTAPFDAPYGTFTNWGTVDGRTGNWDPDNDGFLTDSEAQWDLAVIGLRSPIGETSGWVQPLQLAEDFNGTMVGFPARPSSGVSIGMMQEAAWADASSRYGVYDIASSLGAGASGGPLLYTSGGQSYVAGVLSSGTSDNSLSTYAGLYGPGNWDWLARVTAANDSLPGTAGLDTVAFGGVRASYQLRASGGVFIITSEGRNGADRLEQVERLQFGDGNVALDLGGSAGLVARILGAVFGPASVGNQQYAWIGLWHLDHGMGYQDLVQLALDVRLGNNADDAAVVDLLYGNVVGTAPAAEEADYYLGLLDSGQATQAGLGVFAADTALNAARIGLTGLAASGLAYDPVG
jgi:V8-like Glu-specific endopeptidase